MKLSSRDALQLLRQYKIAGADNVPRHISAIKTTHPILTNTVVTFCFLSKQYHVLFDDAADDDVEYATSQIKKIDSDTKFRLIENPYLDTTDSFSIPFKGKDCYLFTVIAEKKRLDVELTNRYPEMSRSTWQKHIKTGHVSINGNVVKSVKYGVTSTDSISLDIPEATDFSESKLPILYVDDNVIVINKPAGILSHSKGALNDEFTVAGFFKQYTTYSNGTNRPGIIHRLDRDTSGVMMGARNEETATMLQKQFADRKTKKTYIAIVVGAPKFNTANIDLPIIRNPAKPSTFKVDGSGKTAQTHYEVLEANEKYSLVLLKPRTGRTHQLRVHMDYINTPVLGDRVYGKGKAADRLYLHAYSLEITIPGGERKTFIAPVPDEFKKYFPNISL